MNIIFLDIDGVLIPEKSYYFKDVGHVIRKPFNYLDDLVHATPLENIRSLQLLANDRDAEFVLISSWRQIFEEDFLQDYFTEVGLFHYFHKDWIAVTNSYHSKGKDVKKWLDKHPEVKDWCIIDDEDTSISSFCDVNKHLIKPNPKKGYEYDGDANQDRGLELQRKHIPDQGSSAEVRVQI